MAKEIAAFKKLKAHVDAQRGVVAAQPKAVEQPPAPKAAEFIESRQFERAMSEVEARLNSQVSDLKAQLAALQEELNNLRSR